MSPVHKSVSLQAERTRLRDSMAIEQVGLSVLILVASSRSPLTTNRLLRRSSSSGSALLTSTHLVGMILRPGISLRSWCSCSSVSHCPSVYFVQLPHSLRRVSMSFCCISGVFLEVQLTTSTFLLSSLSLLELLLHLTFLSTDHKSQRCGLSHSFIIDMRAYPEIGGELESKGLQSPLPVLCLRPPVSHEVQIQVGCSHSSLPRHSGALVELPI